MPEVPVLLKDVILFGGGLCLLMAIQQLSGRNPDRLDVLGFFLLGANGIITANVGMALTRDQLEHPLFSLLFIPAIYAVGPLNLFYYHSLLHGRRAIPYKTWLHILPALLALASAAVFMSMGEAYREETLREVFESPGSSPYAMLILAGSVHVLSYLSYLMAVEHGLWDSREIRSEIRFLTVLNLAAIIAVILLTGGFFLEEGVPLAAGGVLLTLIHSAVFLAHHRYPHFFKALSREIKRKRYEKSVLGGVNTELLRARLMELMRDEELYKDMELNLKTVSDLLSITPHQLSQFLNEHLNQDFRNFVNAFRVEEAKRQLVEHPEKGILEICFDAGFNSKSTFNAVFKKHTGKTPREYRAQALT
ncbi:MAG TPA: helix-turn-helix domain-containing protein [Deltaproteobacteria bacterium]|nr:helix-turn-helix domain-containing protein [Deltaproteobacteria bacterium]HOM27859.1 helix-turn-helix domain-containing protein [Deltaproteobacteria bacterium]HPP79593.1 helix-turn-helix domain-containing protein [Deltaproteobacteria bacterium]